MRNKKPKEWFNRIILISIIVVISLFFVSCNTDAVIEEPDVANSEPLENMSATCEGISEFKMDAEAVTESSFDQSKNFAVVLKENIADKTKTDIYLVDPQNGQEIYYMTQSEI